MVRSPYLIQYSTRRENSITNMAPPNGLRYPLVGGTRQRQFDGTSSKPRKRLKNVQTPTSRVHALLGGVTFMPHFYAPQILRGKVKDHWQPIGDKLRLARFQAEVP